MATTKQDKIRNKLQNKVFDVFGKSVTFKKQNTITYNDRGEEESVTYTTSTITIVPYNIITNRQTFEAFGQVEEGDFDAAVPYDVDIGQGDIITMEDEDFKVREVQHNYLPDNVVSIVRLSRVRP